MVENVDIFSDLWTDGKSNQLLRMSTKSVLETNGIFSAYLIKQCIICIFKHLRKLVIRKKPLS